MTGSARILGTQTLLSFLAQLSSALGLLLATPVFLAYLGRDAYGLIGLMATLQALLYLLDLGFSTALMRETAAWHTDRLRREFDGFFRFIALLALLGLLLCCVASLIASEALATRWLESNNIPARTLQFCVALLLLQLGLRWLTTFARAFALGLQRIGRASSVQIGANLARYGVAAGLLAGPGLDLQSFFLFQLLVAIMELLGMLFIARDRFPRPVFGPLTLSKLGPELRMTGMLSLAVILWTLTSQLDRIILSNRLTLEEFGVYVLGVTLASGVLLATGPLGAILIPRLTSLRAKADNLSLENNYFIALSIVTIGSAAVALILMLFTDAVLYVWLGDLDRGGKEVRFITQLFALGNLAMVVSSLPYYLQVAIGDLRYHIAGALLSATILLPMMLLLLKEFGPVGAAGAWALVNCLMTSWSLWITSKLIQRQAFRRWVGSVAQPLFLMLAFLLLCSHYGVSQLSRINTLLMLCMISALAIFVGIAASSLRRLIIETYQAGIASKDRSG